MKSILRAIAKRYSIYLALEDINKECGTDFTDADIIKWNHISEADAIAEIKKLNGEQEDKRSVATKDGG